MAELVASAMILSVREVIMGDDGGGGSAAMMALMRFKSPVSVSDSAHAPLHRRATCASRSCCISTSSCMIGPHALF